MSIEDLHTNDKFPGGDKLKESPFSLPENYMDDLGDRLKALKEDTPELDLSKETPFSVPQNYFDQIKAENFIQKKQSNGNIWYMAMSVAAIFLICLAVFGDFGESDQSTPHQKMATASSTETSQDNWDLNASNLLAYVEDNYINDMHDDELSDLLDGTDILDNLQEDQTEEIIAPIETPVQITTTDITEEDIEDYLEDEYSVDELIDEL